MHAHASYCSSYYTSSYMIHMVAAMHIQLYTTLILTWCVYACMCAHAYMCVLWSVLYNIPVFSNSVIDNYTFILIYPSPKHFYITQCILHYTMYFTLYIYTTLILTWCVYACMCAHAYMCVLWSVLYNIPVFSNSVIDNYTFILIYPSPKHFYITQCILHYTMYFTLYIGVCIATQCTAC